MIRVVAGIIFRGGKVLIAQRASHKSFPGKWEFPGGKIEPGEEPELALERELREEFQITTKTKAHFKTVDHAYQDLKIRLIAYFSDFITGEFILSDHDKIRWVAVPDLNRYDLAEADVPIVDELVKVYFDESEELKLRQSYHFVVNTPVGVKGLITAPISNRQYSWDTHPAIPIG